MSKAVTTDVDIDLFGREILIDKLGCPSGRIDRPDGGYNKHNTGVYFQDIPYDPVSKVVSLDHKAAAEYGYFKIDLLNVNIYGDVSDEAHLLALMDREPPWDFFEYREITDQLFHLNGHGDLLLRYKPQSIEDLAMVLAIIRPAKSHLKFSGWDRIRSEVWVKDKEGVYQFHRGHAIAYALAVVVNLNLLIEKMGAEESGLPD